MLWIISKMSAPLYFLKQEIINKTRRDLDKTDFQVISLVQGLVNFCSFLMTTCTISLQVSDGASFGPMSQELGIGLVVTLVS